jgi:hypothetical protein
MLLDGQHTGRYRWDQLYKTEKTHFGTLVEINLQREFGFSDGQAMDFAIQGIDVDCQFENCLNPPDRGGYARGCHPRDVTQGILANESSASATGR